MEMLRVLRPGQNGTKQLLKEYGDKLLCVRYRYNYQTHKCYKTIELVISEQDWTPPAPHPEEERPPKLTERINIREVAVRIDWQEKSLQQAMREIGGRWDRKKRYWYAQENLVKRLGLEDRIVRRG